MLEQYGDYVLLDNYCESDTDSEIPKPIFLPFLKYFQKIIKMELKDVYLDAKQSEIHTLSFSWDTFFHELLKDPLYIQDT